ncbi:MAG: helix-turn-helix domain-containing protein [Lachnospira sp.]
MIYAYDKVYLNNVQRLMGAMFQYVVYDCKLSLTEFYERFLESTYSDKIAYGDILTLTGKTGAEIAIEVMEINNNDIVYSGCYTKKSQEYWAGWALAYYQWYCGKSLKIIQQEVPLEQIIELYNPFHEMDITQFVDKMRDLSQRSRMVSYLKKYRELAGLSQSELSRITDIPVKSIQQYEQRRKDINKAQVETVIKLARALCCNVEDLLEM